MNEVRNEVEVTKVKYELEIESNLSKKTLERILKEQLEDIRQVTAYRLEEVKND